MSDEWESATQSMLITQCPHCANEIKIEKRWTAGGVNDYGGWIIKCNRCKKPFEVHIGRDVSDSEMLSGGAVLDKYDDELKNRQEILKKHGIKSVRPKKSRRKASAKKSPARKKASRTHKRRGKSKKK